MNSVLIRSKCSCIERDTLLALKCSLHLMAKVETFQDEKKFCILNVVAISWGYTSVKTPHVVCFK